MNAADLFWLAPALPLTTFVALVAGLVGAGRKAAGLAVAAIAGSAVVSVLALIAAANSARAEVSVLWLTVGGRQLALALWLDPLAAVVAVLVSVVALVVFVYALRYMAGDSRCGRFFALLSLFAGAMLTLVLAADLLTLFIAWELVGLCSYLLIGFWFERPGVPAAATKALLTTRLTDLAVLAGVLVLVGAAGSSRIAIVVAAATSGQIAPGLLLASTLLLFIGAAGKSAQVPFQGWLPDAMVGPTPVSALLHSATMVAAGVFLVARLHILFAIARPTLLIVAWVGVATALLGGAAALVQTELKRTLAYSTMSQLGLMFVGLGAGSLLAGVVVLLAQALYKATLFLAAGAIDQAIGGTTFERMGGLARRMPFTFAASALSAAALAGLPVTLALPPKDPALAAAWRANPPLFWVALLASFLTALYSARFLGLVFLGPSTQPAQNAQRAPRGLLIPLLALAALIPIGLLADASLLGQPLSQVLGTGVPEAGVASALGLGVAVLGIALGVRARYIWPAAVVWPPLSRIAPLFAGEFGLATLYRATPRLGLWMVEIVSMFDQRVFDPLGGWFARGTVTLAQRAASIDRAVFDAFAATAAAWMIATIQAGARFDLRRLDAAFTAAGRALLAASQRLRDLQTGRIENYLLGMLLWGLGVIAVAALVLVLR